ncbi:hypothetical protein, partial [Aliiglaciecola litoralis]|uniref:hypothetical protein n=1 Tax=Aliiglaciecola litoralis TaxID=582857 RepID=UPI0031D40BFE
MTYNKLPKIAAYNAAGTNTHWASPNNVRICPLAKRYMPMKRLKHLLLHLSILVLVACGDSNIVSERGVYWKSEL